MKISLSLLKRYLDLDLPIKRIADLLTLAGLEAEKVENETPPFENVVSAKVVEVTKHPDSDKLQIATVFDGNEHFQVVCGASNCRKNLITAFAKIGAKLKDVTGSEFIIQKSSIRNVESFGMLCSEKELGIGNSHDGIMEFPNDYPIGANLSEKLWDPVFELGLTPNLGHCMSARGIAKILSAVANIPYKEENSFSLPSFESNEKTIDCKISATSGCDRYSYLIIDNLQKAKTPFEIERILIANGIRPIHIVVDILNFVMLETGQPMHGFDKSLIEGDSIEVAYNESTESFEGLDDKTYNLPKNSLVIKDAKKTLALAGILGGKNSAISESTSSVLLEAAHFSYLPIRKTSHKLNLRTDSSLRFEKETDPNMTISALKKAAAMICHYCQGSAYMPQDICLKEFHERKISLRFERVNKILGTELSHNEIIEIFSKLQFQFKQTEKALEVFIPTSRNDLKLEIDLIEEIVVVYGLNNIPRKKTYFTTSSVDSSPIYLFNEQVKNQMINLGLQEVITCDLISENRENLLEKMNIEKNQFVHVLHAKSQDQSLLRPSLLPSFLDVVSLNFDQKTENLQFFETTRTHIKTNDSYQENWVLGICIAGKQEQDNWKEKAQNVSFYNLKGIIENLLNKFTIHATFEPIQTDIMHPYQTAKILLNGTQVGILGQIHPTLLNESGIKKPIFFAELLLTEIFKKHQAKIAVESLSTFPGSERDWTITLNKNISFEIIRKAIEKSRPEILEKWNLIDLFADEEKVGKDNKNLTFRFSYRDKEKTLSSKEVDHEHNELLKKVMNFLVTY